MSAKEQVVCPQCGSGSYESMAWEVPEKGGHPYGRKCTQCGTRYVAKPSKLAAIRWFVYALLFFGFGAVTGVMSIVVLVDQGFRSPWGFLLGVTVLSWTAARYLYRTGRSAFR